MWQSCNGLEGCRRRAGDRECGGAASKQWRREEEGKGDVRVSVVCCLLHTRVHYYIVSHLGRRRAQPTHAYTALGPLGTQVMTKVRHCSLTPTLHSTSIEQRRRSSQSSRSYRRRRSCGELRESGRQLVWRGQGRCSEVVHFQFR